MDNKGNNLKINVDPILDQFEWLICMNQFRSPVITPWGHSFCEDCIHECLNLKKQCPHCNKPCQPVDLIKNYQLEDILNQLHEAKKQESEKYFNKIANNEENQEGVIKDKSPIETVSFGSFPNYFSYSLVQILFLFVKTFAFACVFTEFLTPIGIPTKFKRWPSEIWKVLPVPARPKI